MISLPRPVVYTGPCRDIPTTAVLVSVVDDTDEQAAFIMVNGKVYGVLLSQLIPAS